jgi:hypothetical protein
MNLRVLDEERAFRAYMRLWYPVEMDHWAAIMLNNTMGYQKYKHQNHKHPVSNTDVTVSQVASVANTDSVRVESSQPSTTPKRYLHLTV